MTPRGICAELFCLPLPKSFNMFIYSHIYGFCLYTCIRIYLSNLKDCDSLSMEVLKKRTGVALRDMVQWAWCG